MKATIVYIIDKETNEVLMAKKRRKVGVGYWFGYGGKIEDDETPEQCTIRETFKESGNIIKLNEADLEPLALISFYKGKESGPLNADPVFEVIGYRIFVNKHEIGIPVTTDEMADPQWFSIINGIPWDKMKPGDELILPQILLGAPVKGWVHFSDDSTEVLGSSIMPCKIREITFPKAA